MTTWASDKTFAVVTAAYTATLLVLTAVPFLGEPRLWGFNSFGFLPRYSLLLLAPVGVGAYFYSRRLVTRQSASTTDHQARSTYWLIAFVIVVTFAAAFVLLRNRTHFLGDGYQLLGALESGGGVVKPWNVAIHLIQAWLVSLLGGGPDGALKTFQVISIGSGIVALVSTAWAARSLRVDLADRILLLLGIATGGFVMLYFGYVENYPPFVTAVLVFLLLGLISMHGALSRWWALVPLIVAGLCHPYAVALIPAALYLFFRDTAIGQRVAGFSRSTMIIASAALLLSFVVALYFLIEASYFLRFAILPVVANRFTVDGYTMFSLKHLVDLAGLLFMLVPPILVMLALVGSSAFQSVRRSPAYRFLIVAGLSSLILTFIFDPRLGMPRDWDLFSFAGLPPLLLLYYTLTDRRSSFPWRRSVAVLAIALSLLVLAPRVVTQSSPERSIAMFDSFSEMDPVRNVTGRFVLLQYLRDHGREAEAEQRMAAHAAYLRHEVLSTQGEEALRQKDYGKAIALLRQAVQLAPNWSHAWANLGACYLDLNRLDSAETCLKIADGLNPFNAQTYDYLAFLYLTRNDLEEGEKYCRKALEVDPTDFNARGNLLKVYYRTGRTEEYRNMAYELAEEDFATADFVLIAANERLRTNNTPEAVRLYRKALELGADTAYIRSLEQKFPGLRIIP